MSQAEERNRMQAVAKAVKVFAFEVNEGAGEVYLAGDFNNWNPKATRMIRHNGEYRARVQLEPGEHQYKFVVDGVWYTDPSAVKQVPNGMGSMNSVVRA